MKYSNFLDALQNTIRLTRYGLTCIVLVFISQGSFAQGEWDEVEIKAIKISDNIHMLQGRGGNIMVQTGEEGVLIIDSQFAPLSEKIHAAVRELSDGPIQYLLNTHWHGDHTGGNEAMSNHGATIIAHENVLKRMSEEQFMKAFSRTVPPSPENARPDITFSDDMTINFNGERGLIFHFENGHTDGDAVIFFPKSNVIHLGDLYFQDRYPFIDISSGGSMDGVLKALNSILFIINDKTTIIPGHGTLSNRKELIHYRHVLQTLRDNVHDAMADGKTQEEIEAMPVGGEYEEAFGAKWIKAKDLVNVIMATQK